MHHPAPLRGLALHHSGVGMTTSEQAELKLVVRLAKWAVAGGLIAAFTFGLWVARLQGEVERVPQMVAEHQQWKQVMQDFMLLACAKDGLNITERAVCARYRR